MKAPADKPQVGFFDMLYSSTNVPPRHGLAAQVGLGKTRAYIMHLPRLLEHLKPGHCILITVPDHKLSGALKQRLSKASLKAKIYLGPNQVDPEHPENNMCLRPEDLQSFQAAGAGSTLCKACKFASVCGYQRQKKLKSPIWIAAHQILFRKRRAPIPPVDFVIIDEDPVKAGLQSTKRIGGAQLPVTVQKAIAALPERAPFSRKDFAVTDSTLKDLARSAKGIAINAKSAATKVMTGASIKSHFPFLICDG